MTELEIEEAKIEEEAKKPNAFVMAFLGILTGLKVLVTNPCTRWIYIGNLTLSISQFLFSYSLTKYFNFYGHPSTYATVNFVCVLAGGCTSCIGAGILANMLDKKT